MMTSNGNDRTRKTGAAEELLAEVLDGGICKLRIGQSMNCQLGSDAFLFRSANFLIAEKWTNFN